MQRPKFNLYNLYRQTDRQIDRQIDRQTDRQVGRQVGRQVDRQIDREIDRFIYNLKSFSNQHSDSVSKLSSSESSLAFLSSFIYMKHLFYTQHFVPILCGQTFEHASAFKDTYRALKHSRLSESTEVLGEPSEGTRARKALWHLDTRRALGQLST